MIYSERARIAIKYANQETARLGHENIGTGHILLGLIRQGEGTAIEILKDASVDIDELKNELEALMEEGNRGAFIGRLKLGTRAMDALRYAEEESKNMGHQYLGTEHLLLGIMREYEGVGAKALSKFGVVLQKARSIAQAVVVKEEEPAETLTFQNTGMTLSTYNNQVISNTQEYGNDILDIEEASRLLKISIDDMNSLLINENIPSRKINGQWRFSRSALIKWLGDGNSKDY